MRFASEIAAPDIFSVVAILPRAVEPGVKQHVECRLLGYRPHAPAKLAGQIGTVAYADYLEAGRLTHCPARADNRRICGLRAAWRKKQHRAATMALDAPLRCRQNDLMMLGQHGFDRLEPFFFLVIRNRCAGNFDEPRIVYERSASPTPSEKFAGRFLLRWQQARRL